MNMDKKIEMPEPGDGFKDGPFLQRFVSGTGASVCC